MLYKDDTELVKDTKKAQDLMTELRRMHLTQRQEEAASKQGHFDACGLLPGDIVVLRNRPRPGEGRAHKLERRYKFKFVVVIARGASVYIRPYSLQSIEKWCQSARIENRSKETNLVLPTFRVDITDVEKIKHAVHLYNSNQRNLHYSEHTMATPKLSEVQVLTPVTPDLPSCFDEESAHDKYSDYGNFPTQEETGDDYENNDDDYDVKKVQDQEYYFYDDDDVLRQRSLGSSSLHRPKEANGKLRLVFRGDNDQSTIKDVNQCVKITRKSPVDLSERLARLAGYSLRNSITLNSVTKKVTFYPKVKCHYYDVTGCGEKMLNNTKGEVKRIIGPRLRPLSLENSPSIVTNYFDNVCLEETPCLSRNIDYCTCSRCQLPDIRSPCFDEPCSLCRPFQPLLWS